MRLKSGLGVVSDKVDNLKGHPETIDLLRKHGGKSGVEDSIIVAASLGNVNAVKKHLAAGADVDAKSGLYKWTPLHDAALKGH